MQHTSQEPDSRTLLAITTRVRHMLQEQPCQSAPPTVLLLNKTWTLNDSPRVSLHKGPFNSPGHTYGGSITTTAPNTTTTTGKHTVKRLEIHRRAPSFQQHTNATEYDNNTVDSRDNREWVIPRSHGGEKQQQQQRSSFTQRNEYPPHMSSMPANATTIMMSNTEEPLRTAAERNGSISTTRSRSQRLCSPFEETQPSPLLDYLMPARGISTSSSNNTNYINEAARHSSLDTTTQQQQQSIAKASLSTIKSVDSARADSLWALHISHSNNNNNTVNMDTSTRSRTPAATSAVDNWVDSPSPQHPSAGAVLLSAAGDDALAATAASGQGVNPLQALQVVAARTTAEAAALSRQGTTAVSDGARPDPTLILLESVHSLSSALRDLTALNSSTTSDQRRRHSAADTNNDNNNNSGSVNGFAGSSAVDVASSTAAAYTASPQSQTLPYRSVRQPSSSSHQSLPAPVPTTLYPGMRHNHHRAAVQPSPGRAGSSGSASLEDERLASVRMQAREHELTRYALQQQQQEDESMEADAAAYTYADEEDPVAASSSNSAEVDRHDDGNTHASSFIIPSDAPRSRSGSNASSEGSNSVRPSNSTAAAVESSGDHVISDRAHIYNKFNAYFTKNTPSTNKSSNTRSEQSSAARPPLPDPSSFSRGSGGGSVNDSSRISHVSNHRQHHDSTEDTPHTPPRHHSVGDICISPPTPVLMNPPPMHASVHDQGGSHGGSSPSPQPPRRSSTDALVNSLVSDAARGTSFVPLGLAEITPNECHATIVVPIRLSVERDPLISPYLTSPSRPRHVSPSSWDDEYNDESELPSHSDAPRRQRRQQSASALSQEQKDAASVQDLEPTVSSSAMEATPDVSSREDKPPSSHIDDDDDSLTSTSDSEGKGEEQNMVPPRTHGLASNALISNRSTAGVSRRTAHRRPPLAPPPVLSHSSGGAPGSSWVHTVLPASSSGKPPMVPRSMNTTTDSQHHQQCHDPDYFEEDEEEDVGYGYCAGDSELIV